MNYNKIFIKPNDERQEKRKLLSLGALFKNNNKSNPKSPDMTGTLDIEPADFAELLKQHQANPDQPVAVRLAGWLKKSSKGDQYLTAQLSPPFRKQDQPKPANDNKSSLDEFLSGNGGKDGDGQ